MKIYRKPLTPAQRQELQRRRALEYLKNKAKEKRKEREGNDQKGL